jgi:ABC-type molybdate transport system permease subunit
MQTLSTAITSFRSQDRDSKACCYVAAVLFVVVSVLVLVQVTGVVQ